VAKVTVEVNSTTNKVEKIYPFRAGVPVNPEPGRYAVPNVDDFIVALGFICDPNTSPVTFAPDPNPPADPQTQRALAEDMLVKASEMTATANALLSGIG
jgi:hypothetical protein